MLENKHFKSKLKKYILLPTCSSEHIQSALMHGNKRKQLEMKLSTTQGEAKLFVFITKTHRKEMQNTKQPKANGEKSVGGFSESKCLFLSQRALVSLNLC